MKYFGLVWAGLWRKKVRTIFTMLSIVVAFVLFGLLQGVNQGMNALVENLEVDRLYVSARTSMTDGLPIAHLAKIATVPGVKEVSHWTYFGGYFQDQRTPIPAFATNAEALFKIYKELEIAPEYLEAMRTMRTGVLVSEALAQKHGWKVGDRIPIGTTIWTTKSGSNTWEFDVVGTFDASDYGAGFPSFYLNQEYFKEASAFGGNIVHYFLVGIDSPREATTVSNAIDALFANSTNETRTQTESALMQMQLKQVGDINFILNAIVGAVLFTLLFLTANTMMQSVRERTSELAVLKTLGYSDGKVLALVLVESLILCAFAAGIGLALAAAIFFSPIVRGFFGAIPLPTVVLVAGAAMAAMLAFVSGFPPAWRAKRLNIVDALAGR